MTGVLRLLVFVALLFGSTALATTAQEATPSAGLEEEVAQTGTAAAFPLVVDPALCTVDPRDPEALLDLWFPAGATPGAAVGTQEQPAEVTIPLGEPLGPDETVVTGITLTVQEVLACFSAGDFPRALALFTDDLVMSFGPGPGETREDVAGFLDATPAPEPGAAPAELLAITNVMLLEDGRVGAFVVDRQVLGETAVTGTVFVIFEQGGDRWLVDEVIEFPLPAGEEG